MNCAFCTESIPDTVTECPHCGRPSLFPNVAAAAEPAGHARLMERAKEAAARAAVRGATDRVDDFAKELASAEAIINRYFGELFRLAWSDDQIYSTYYHRVNAGIQLPEGDSWNRLRGIADTILFGDHNKKSIRFAALSLDGEGLENYGDCSLTVKTSMISHRASVFEENAVIFMERQDVSGQKKFAVPLGFNAPWQDRIMLCLAKLSDQIQPGTSPVDFPHILLHNGPTPEEDQFIEVHIWGSLTIRSLRRVIVRHWVSPPLDVDVTAFKARLSGYGVQFVAP